MENTQAASQPIDVANWLRDEEFARYPEGARDKTLLYCPTSSPFGFLIADHRYLFKLSSRRYPEQFWTEILAYRLGVQMDIEVPPAFVAFDSNEKQSGALIEWFLHTNELLDEVYTSGGDYSQQYIPNFDRKKGKQHNFETVSQIFEDLNKKQPPLRTNWITYWAKAFLFDALIGNTDRHQDNWGTIATFRRGEKTPISARISPVFDNGTSMGHEIFPKKFTYYEEDNHLEKYVSKGWHHMKWKAAGSQMSHVEMLKKLIDRYRDTRKIMLNCLKMVSDETFNSILNELVAFDVPTRLTTERAAFMLRLLQFRHQQLLVELEN